VWRILDARERLDVIQAPGAGLSWVECAQCAARAEIDAPLLLVRPGDPLSLLLAVDVRELDRQLPGPPSAPLMVQEAEAALGRSTAGIAGPMIPLPRPLLAVVLGRDVAADLADPEHAVAEISRVESDCLGSWYRRFLEIVRGTEDERNLEIILEQVWRVPWTELAVFLDEHPDAYGAEGIARARTALEAFRREDPQDPGREQIQATLEARLTLLLAVAGGHPTETSVYEYLSALEDEGGLLNAKLFGMLDSISADQSAVAIPAVREALRMADAMGRTDIADALSGDLGYRLLQLPITDNAIIEEAVFRLQRALASMTEDHPRWAATAGNLAAAYQQRVAGDAVENWERARALVERLADSLDRQATPDIWALYQTNYGHLLGERPGGSSAAELTSAIERILAALEVRSPERGIVDWSYSQVNLGVLYRRRNARGDLALAVGCYRQALARLLPGDDLYLWATLQHNLVDALLASEPPDLDGAEAAADAALAEVNRTTDPQMAGRLIAALARVEERRSSLREPAVIRLRREALSLLDPVLAPAWHLTVGGSLADAYYQLGDWEAVGEIYDGMLTAFDNLYNAQVSAEGRRTVLAVSPRLARWAAYVYARIAQPERAVEIIERGRARELSESVSRDTADIARLATVDPQLANRYAAALAQYRSALEQASAMLPAPRTGIQTAAAEQDIRDALAAIREVPGFERFLLPMHVAEILAAVGGDPVVYLVSAPAGSYVLEVRSGGSGEPVVTSTAVPSVTSMDIMFLVMVGEAGEPGLLSAQYAEGPAWRLPEALDRLSVLEPLMRPVAQTLADSENRTAVVVPTGFLGFVPIPAIAVDGKILDDIGEIRLAPSAASYAACRSRADRQNPIHLVGIANPAGVPPSLPGTESELAAICDLFGPDALVSTATGAEATRSWLLAQVPSASHLHLGCHGASSLSSASGGVLILAGGEPLTTDDLLDGRLAHCRLAVASACQSGHYSTVGTPDEFAGLPAGFLQAGAACAVSSLWQVDDIATALLMTRFYELLDPSLSGSEQHPVSALRQARIWLRNLSDREAGTYWAAHPRLSRRYRRPDRSTSATTQYGSQSTPYASPEYWAAFVAWGC
jgi:CHAT domain-containing protein/tetratricopeptide (TPR) repeat protein